MRDRRARFGPGWILGVAPQPRIGGPERLAQTEVRQDAADYNSNPGKRQEMFVFLVGTWFDSCEPGPTCSTKTETEFSDRNRLQPYDCRPILFGSTPCSCSS